MKRIHLPHWRPTTWVLGAWTAIAAVLIAALASVSSDCNGNQLCEAIDSKQTEDAIVLLVVLWALGFLVIAGIALLRRRR